MNIYIYITLHYTPCRNKPEWSTSLFSLSLSLRHWQISVLPSGGLFCRSINRIYFLTTVPKRETIPHSQKFPTNLQYNQTLPMGVEPPLFGKIVDCQLFKVTKSPKKTSSTSQPPSSWRALSQARFGEGRIPTSLRLNQHTFGTHPGWIN